LIKWNAHSTSGGPRALLRCSGIGFPFFRIPPSYGRAHGERVRPLVPEQFEERFLPLNFMVWRSMTPHVLFSRPPGRMRLIEVMMNENQFPFPFDLGNLAELPEALQLSVADFPFDPTGFFTFE